MHRDDAAGPPRPLVIGVGNDLRGDDGVGWAVVRRVRALVADQVEAVEWSGDGAGLCAAWRGRPAVWVVDAVVSGAPPGAIRRLEAHLRPVPASFRSVSSHALGLGAAIELARALGDLPARLVVYGVEGSEFAPGSGLSAAVAAAVEETARRLVEELGCTSCP